MRQFFNIMLWEFFRHFKSRSFLLATFISPIIFALIVLIPSIFLENREDDESRIIGCVEFDTTRICEDIKTRFEGLYVESDVPHQLELVSLKSDTSMRMADLFIKLSTLKADLDSLEDEYTKIKERRKYVFQKPKTRSREALLKKTYENLIQTREARDLAQLDYQKAKSLIDSLWRTEIVSHADYLLRNQKIEGYLLIDPEEFEQGLVEFHSLLPANFLQLDPVKQAVQVVIVEERMKQEGVRVDQIQEWLEPVIFKDIQLQGTQKQEFDFMINYMGPIVAVLFLFISIFTSSGFLFNSVINEKTNRVIEVILSSVNHTQLIAGKIFGLGILGIFQIIIWYGLTLILIGLDILNVGQIGFLTVKNAGLFLLYFVLGYLFFASVFVGIGSLFSSEEDAHHFNQFVRMLSIFPIVLAVLVLETPNSLLVRILSFIPPLTPTFMILRTPLGNPSIQDYYISSGIMVLSIIISIFAAGKLFRVGTLLYGKKITIRQILEIIIGKS